MTDEVMRGYVVKLYPTQDQTKWLWRCQVELRTAWNVLVEQHEKWIDMTIHRAVVDGIIDALPPRPEKTAERSAKREWNRLRLSATITASKHARSLKIAWPSLTLHKANYEPLMIAVREKLAKSELECSITAFRAVMKRFSVARVPRKGNVKWRAPRYKRDAPPWLEYMPIQLLDGFPLESGFGKNYTLRLWGESIRARGGDSPVLKGRPVAGVQVTRSADGWHAAVRFGGAARELPVPTAGVVGVVFGLQMLATLSDGRTVVNPRGEEYAKLVAWHMEKAAELAGEGLENEAEDMRARLKRYQLKWSCKTMNSIYTELLPMLVAHDRIYIGEMAREDVQGEVNRLGEDDDGGSLSACGIARRLIEERYGDRVVKVPLPGIADENAREMALALLHPREAA